MEVNGGEEEVKGWGQRGREAWPAQLLVELGELIQYVGGEEVEHDLHCLVLPCSKSVGEHLEVHALACLLLPGAPS